tara:strand:+ start:2614 stop:3399 length:786 start_codon:yes stop_codon:yes gene_type:complete
MAYDSYGALDRISSLDNRISKLMAQGGGASPRAQGRLARLMAKRDGVVAKEAAKKGAQMAAASIPGLAGGLASSGIRGYDLIEQEFTPETIRLHNVEGDAQGQRFTAVAPPGSGRLVPINFIVAGAVNPVHTIVGGAAAIGATTNLVTQSINWAVLRIVAVTTQSTPAAVGVLGVMQDFKIGGSPNLFLVEDWVLMDDYDVDKEQFAGLRAYPVLISPNTSLISVAAFAPAAQSLYATVSIVTEVLRDDAFGPGLPGPYGR